MHLSYTGSAVGAKMLVRAVRNILYLQLYQPTVRGLYLLYGLHGKGLGM